MLIIQPEASIINDGLQEIYVNTRIDDGTELGELMQLFNQTEVNNPKFPEFTKRMNYIKHSEGGRREMCEVMEKYAKEYVDEVIKEKIINALQNGKSPEIIADFFDLPLEKILQTKTQMQRSSDSSGRNLL